DRLSPKSDADAAAVRMNDPIPSIQRSNSQEAGTAPRGSLAPVGRRSRLVVSSPTTQTSPPSKKM
ncbi:hypothetical protein J6590_102398, partial [Homalodisca vitripennis]